MFGASYASKLFLIFPKSKTVSLYNQTAGWLDTPRVDDWEDKSITNCGEDGGCSLRILKEPGLLLANGAWLRGWWPATTPKGNTTPPLQPQWAPHCSGERDRTLPPWTSCQDKRIIWAVKGYFTFLPHIGTSFNKTFSGYNWTYQNPTQKLHSNPFDNWMLCGVNGSCTDLSPFAMIGGGAMGNEKMSPWHLLLSVFGLPLFS